MSLAPLTMIQTPQKVIYQKTPQKVQYSVSYEFIHLNPLMLLGLFMSEHKLTLPLKAQSCLCLLYRDFWVHMA